MRRFAGIVESSTAPPTNCIWLNNGDAKYFSNGEWKSMIGADLGEGGEDLSGYVKEQGDKIDSLDKEVGGIQKEITSLKSTSHPAVFLEIGDSSETKEANLKTLNETINLYNSNVFQTNIDYGYGVGSFIQGTGGTAHVITSMGIMVHYDIHEDGSVTKVEETDIPHLVENIGTPTSIKLGMVYSANSVELPETPTLENLLGAITNLQNRLVATGVLEVSN